MTPAVSKKMLNLMILDILRHHSDDSHHLSQQQIIDHLWQDYGMSCERKAVGRNIAALMEYGFDIVTVSGGGCYLASREFDDSELRLLIDSIYFSRHIPPRQSKTLIEKLQGLSSPGFGGALHNVSGLPALHYDDSQQFFYTLAVLDEAITEKRKVELMLNRYGIDKKLHPVREKKYVVNPYQLVAANARYYLVGNHDHYDNATHLRIDRISDCVILPDKAKPLTEVEGLEKGFKVSGYMAEHVYMNIGNSEPTVFRVMENNIGDVIDWFGKDVEIRPDQKPGYCVVGAVVNQTAMRYWALQYSDTVEVLLPETLRAEIGKTAQNVAQKYK